MSNIIHLNDENFENVIADGVTLVDFHASWCGPCRMIAPVVEELANHFGGKARIAKLDIEEAQETTASLGITSVPTLILFKNGKEVKRVFGVKDLEFLRSLVMTQL